MCVFSDLHVYIKYQRRCRLTFVSGTSWKSLHAHVTHHWNGTPHHSFDVLHLYADMLWDLPDKKTDKDNTDLDNALASGTIPTRMIYPDPNRKYCPDTAICLYRPTGATVRKDELL